MSTTDTTTDTNNNSSPDPVGSDPHFRTRLARAYQAQAARRLDLLAANLGMLAGDLMLLAHMMGEQVQAALVDGGASPAADSRLARTIETYLRFVRQVDRFAQLERRPVPAADPSRAVRPYREEPRG